MNIKKIILIITILATSIIYTQNRDIIKITTSASGITKEVAIQDALRSALEQSYGSFISSKTNIKNDELINDEIVSITNGDIHKYEIISANSGDRNHPVFSLWNLKLEEGLEISIKNGTRKIDEFKKLTKNLNFN